MASGGSSCSAAGADPQVSLLTCRPTCLILLLYGMMSALPTAFAHAGHEGSFSLELKSQTTNLPGDITVPYVLEGNNKRHITHKGLKFEYPERMEIILEVTGETVILLLERNKNLIPSHFKVSHNGSTHFEDFKPKTHCFYQGTVAGENGSSVAVSTCDGLRGRLRRGGMSYSIEPLESSVHGEHRVFNLEDLSTGDLGCGVVHENVTHFEEFPSVLPIRLRKKRAILTDTTRWVEFVLVVTNTLYQKRYKSNTSSMIFEMASIVNIVDSDYKTINIRVVLVGLHLMTLDEQALVAENGDTAGVVVGKFASWRQKNYNLLGRNDCSQLMTWESYGGIVGMAFVGTICSRSSSAGIVSMQQRNIDTLAVVAAHEMGHNLGMSHDRTGCACNPPCIMNAGLPAVLPKTFSKCSTDDFENLILVQNRGACLLNVAIPNPEFRQPVCGDGIVDKNEACDCGTPTECQNPCCNAATCQLKGNAECAYGLCCKDCKIVGQGEICRPAVGVCDLPEYCNGSSQFCYADTFIQNGYPCDNNTAYCYNGICLTFTYQCLSIWGGTAVSGSDQCYVILNTKGNEFGNCGQNPDGTFIRCTMENIKCGKLVCEKTPANPLIVDVPNFANYEGCTAVSFNYGPDIPDPGLVQPGTKCGNDSVCMDNQCQNATVVLGTLCDTNNKCNGHGVCNNNLNCDCYYGYAPPDCYYSGYGGSIESGNAYKPPSKLLWLLLLLFIPFIIGGIYFYWSRHGGGRPSRQKKPRTAQPRGMPNAAPNAGHTERPPTVAVITPRNPPSRPPPPATNSATNGGYQPHNPEPTLPISTISPVRPPPAIPSDRTNTSHENHPESEHPPSSSNAPRIYPVRPPPAVPNADFPTDVSYVTHSFENLSHVVVLGDQQPGSEPRLPTRPNDNA